MSHADDSREDLEVEIVQPRQPAFKAVQPMNFRNDLAHFRIDINPRFHRVAELHAQHRQRLKLATE